MRSGQRWCGWFDGGLLVGAVVAIGLSTVSIWWAVPAIGAAFLAGRRMERVRPAVVVLAVVVAVAVPAALLVPAWMVPGTSFLSLVVCAGMGPWMVGRFWRQSQELVRAAGTGQSGWSASSSWWPSRPGCVSGPGSRRTCTTRSATT